jgi:ELWxxDGT repeat protein
MKECRRKNQMQILLMFELKFKYMKTTSTSIVLTIVLLLIGVSINAQPVLLKILPTSASNFISTNGYLYFTTGTDSLWRSNGTASGTIFVKKIGEPIVKMTNLTVGTFFYFTTHESGGHVALWKSNGTSVNTFKIASYPLIEPLIVYHGSLYLGINDGIHGYELWKATSSNVVSIVRDINVGSGSGLGIEYTIANDYIFFTANTGSGGTNLWKTNGTSITTLAVDLPFNDYYSLTTVDSEIFFARVYDSGPNQISEIWITNGTSAGTNLVKQIINPDPGFCNNSISNLLSYNHQLYYDLNTGCGIETHEMWKSNGTTLGTSFVQTMVLDGGMYPFIKVNNRIVFHGTSQNFPGSLKRSDGTAAGTELFYNMNSEPTREFVPVGNLLFFADHTESNFGSIPTNPDNYFQLFTSGLHAENTQPLRDLTGVSYAGANNLRNANGKLFFTTYNDHPSAPVADRVLRLYYYDPTISILKQAPIAQVGTNEELTAFPNPSSDNFMFSITSTGDNLATADIIKIDGTPVKRIFEGTVNEGDQVNFSWNAEELPEGIYICKFLCGTDQRIKKIVVKK